MKNTIIILLLFCSVSFVFGQDRTPVTNTKTISDSKIKADKLFDRMWYKEAAELYEKQISKKEDVDLELLKKAGDAHFFNTDMENAHKYYDQLISNFYSQVDPEYLFRYAHSLQGIGKTVEAKRWMEEFTKRIKSEDTRFENLNQKRIDIESILAIEPNFILKNVTVNTKYSDFGAMYYKNDLIYSSAIDSSNFHTRLYEWNKQPYLNMYLGDLNELESDLKPVDEFSEDLNTRYHEATLAFSKDEKKVYFTRNNYIKGYRNKIKKIRNSKSDEAKKLVKRKEKKNKYIKDLGRDTEGVNHLKLYSAELVKKEGKGNEETWQNVKELPFNSEEYSVGHPTVSSDGKKLYFVSDLNGYTGSTDIFVVDILENGNYSKPRNLGDKINSSGREMFPYITDKRLYFASDGHLGLGGLDVFYSNINADGSFDAPKNLGAPLNSELDDFGFIIKEFKKTGFVCSNREGGKGDDDIYSFIQLEDIDVCKRIVIGKVKDKKTNAIIAGAKIIISDSNNKEIHQFMSDKDGEFTYVSNCEEGTYKAVGSKDGYEPAEITYEIEPEVKLDLNLGLNMDPIKVATPVAAPTIVVNQPASVGTDLYKLLGLRPILFDYNKANIRSDAQYELNKIINYLKEYPTVRIDVQSHTDSRGRDAYNMDLSTRRNTATKNWIIKNGSIARDRISGRGYGESELVNHCGNGVKCSKYEHQQNRRSMFIVTEN